MGSTILAQAAGVPTLPWSGSDVSVSYKDCRGIIPVDVYKRACVHSVEDTLECCNRIQYPCMLKASWGGGGKGIRKVHPCSQNQCWTPALLSLTPMVDTCLVDPDIVYPDTWVHSQGRHLLLTPTLLTQSPLVWSAQHLLLQ